MQSSAVRAGGAGQGVQCCALQTNDLMHTSLLQMDHTYSGKVSRNREEPGIAVPQYPTKRPRVQEPWVQDGESQELSPVTVELQEQVQEQQAEELQGLEHISEFIFRGGLQASSVWSRRMMSRKSRRARSVWSGCTPFITIKLTLQLNPPINPPLHFINHLNIPGWYP